MTVSTTQSSTTRSASETVNTERICLEGEDGLEVDSESVEECEDSVDFYKSRKASDSFWSRDKSGIHKDSNMMTVTINHNK